MKRKTDAAAVVKRYRELLALYHAILNRPHAERAPSLRPLIDEMDGLWRRIGPDSDDPQVKKTPEQLECLAEAQRLYERRIGQ